MVMTDEERRAKKKERAKLYYQKNKEKAKAYQSQYYENNKNKDYFKESQSQYKQTENAKKSNRISRWKRRGIIHNDYDALYQRYLDTNKCEECGIELCFGNCADGRCVDHDHNTGQVRNILCRACNVRRA